MSNYPQKIGEYTKYINQVELVNDVFNGSDNVAKHIRRFPREDNEDYTNRQKDCTLDNHVKRAIETRKNIIFRKDIDLENITNSTLKEWLENDVDLKGTPLTDFAEKLTINSDRDGFTYILVDSPSFDANRLATNQQQQQANIRPYFLNIKREDLIYWEMDQYSSYKVIAFHESYEEREKGQFGFKIKTQIRVLFNDGRVQIYRDNKLVQEYNRAVKNITLVKVGEQNTPLFYDMAKINIKQVNRESEKSYYLRTALAPFPLVYGNLMGDSDGVKTISVNSGLRFTNKTEGGFEWAEMSGKNYEIGKTEINELSTQMEQIAIKFATESKTKTATQVEMESTEDESKLSNKANEIELAINKAIMMLGFYRKNFNVADQMVKLNKDFSNNALDPQQVQQLISLRLNGDLSWDRLNTLLVNGEVLNYLDEQNLATEKTALLNESTGLDE